MLSNIPLIHFIKRLSDKKLEYIEDTPNATLYDIFNMGVLRDWEVETTIEDKKRIVYAQKTMTAVSITRDLSDIQLLKLHSDMFPDFDIKLVFHSDFNIYEVKEKNRTKFLFSYTNGEYTPIDAIF